MRGKVFSKNVVIIIVFCVFWTGLIFFNGSTKGEKSQGISLKVSRVIVNTLSDENDSIQVFNGRKVSKTYALGKVNYIVRKGAHILQYGVLALVLSLVFLLLGLPKIKAIILALCLVLTFGACDEFIQYFVDGRSGSIYDVGFDFVGGIFGVVIFLAWDFVLGVIKE